MTARHLYTVLAGIVIGVLLGVAITFAIDTSEATAVREEAILRDEAISLNRSLRVLNELKDGNSNEAFELLERYLDDAIISLSEGKRKGILDDAAIKAFKAGVEYRRQRPFVRKNATPDAETVQRMIDRIVSENVTKP